MERRWPLSESGGCGRAFYMWMWSGRLKCKTCREFAARLRPQGSRDCLHSYRKKRCGSMKASVGKRPWKNAQLATTLGEGMRRKEKGSGRRERQIDQLAAAKATLEREVEDLKKKMESSVEEMRRVKVAEELEKDKRK
ncbi:hypothetical protein Dimus_003624 [Dionaea muscipula]